MTGWEAEGKLAPAMIQRQLNTKLEEYIVGIEKLFLRRIEKELARTTPETRNSNVLALLIYLSALKKIPGDSPFGYATGVSDHINEDIQRSPKDYSKGISVQ